MGQWEKGAKKCGILSVITTSVIVLLICMGIGTISYPHICQFLYQQEARRINAEYLKRLNEEYEQEDLEWLYRMIVEYNRNLYESRQERLVDAFAYEQVGFSLVQFGFDEEMIGFINIPRMDIELPIYLGANRPNLNRGSAHLTQTTLPVGGNNTNAVIAAHRGMGTAAMFRDIEKLELGDLVYITNFLETLTYRVTKTAVISPDEIEKVMIQKGRDMVTLITCHPYRHNYQRYIVYCERVL